MDVHLKQAIKNVGGLKKLARVLGITHQAILQWRTPPPKHVLKIEEASGVSRYDLRPDIYGPRPGPLARSRREAATAA